MHVCVYMYSKGWERTQWWPSPQHLVYMYPMPSEALSLQYYCRNKDGGFQSNIYGITEGPQQTGESIGANYVH